MVLPCPAIGNGKRKADKEEKQQSGVAIKAIAKRIGVSREYPKEEANEDEPKWPKLPNRKSGSNIPLSGTITAEIMQINGNKKNNTSTSGYFTR